MSYHRSADHRALRAKLIRNWRPWEQSTGPRSDQGKANSARRAFKGGTRGVIREIARALREQGQSLKALPAGCVDTVGGD